MMGFERAWIRGFIVGVGMTNAGPVSEYVGVHEKDPVRDPESHDQHQQDGGQAGTDTFCACFHSAKISKNHPGGYVYKNYHAGRGNLNDKYFNLYLILNRLYR